MRLKIVTRHIFFTLFVCKETFNKILTKIFHTFNFHLQQIIYTNFLLFF